MTPTFRTDNLDDFLELVSELANALQASVTLAAICLGPPSSCRTARRRGYHRFSLAQKVATKTGSICACCSASGQGPSPKVIYFKTSPNAADPRRERRSSCCSGPILKRELIAFLARQRKGCQDRPQRISFGGIPPSVHDLNAYTGSCLTLRIGAISKNLATRKSQLSFATCSVLVTDSRMVNPTRSTTDWFTLSCNTSRMSTRRGLPLSICAQHDGSQTHDSNRGGPYFGVNPESEC